MLCQNCGKYEATTHVKRIVNGESAEAHLCSDCAKALGYNDVFGGFGNTFSEMLGSFFGEPQVSAISSRTIRCEKCGNTFNDIVNSGKIGCADCYTTFYDKLLPSLQRIHGKTRHEGKNPTIIKAEVTNATNPIEDLEEQLRIAIDQQNFEKAAQLRDKINELKEGQK
ncbi:MAG: UvrB/UvrC motif-containing protein [Clostridia bacterium]|nr:UvrB/UvrC motif-containing protein [Clostridia bacterium]